MRLQNKQQQKQFLIENRRDMFPCCKKKMISIFWLPLISTQAMASKPLHFVQLEETFSPTSIQSGTLNRENHNLFQYFEERLSLK